jgi:CDP-2,3-bis-(O-geranylgeranyl)-sn-glycerol synthase
MRLPMLIPPIHAAPASAGAHMHPLLVLKILALVTVANGTPVVAKTILGDRFVAPIDGGSKFVDGRPLLGSSKTIRGIFLSILVTSVFAPVVGLDWKIGVLVASVAMAGDLFSSFLKRRMNLPAGGKATGLDQLPESLFPLLACRSRLSLTAADIIVGVAIFLVGELLLSRLLYHFHLRDHPY